jgi:oligosaccharide repeat unit polymerase
VYVLCAMAFVALLFMTWRFAPSGMCPSVIFVGCWTINVLGLTLISGPLYSVGPVTLAIFFWGAFWFAVGAISVHAAGPPLRLQPSVLNLSSRRFAEKMLTLSLAACLLGFPLFVRDLIKLTRANTEAFLISIRQATVAADSTNLGIGWTENFVTISMFTAMGWLYLYDGRPRTRWLLALSLGISLPYGLFTGSKGGLINFFLGLVFVTAMKHGRLSPRALLVSAVSLATAVVVGFAVFNLAVQQVVGFQLFSSLFDIVRLYWLGNMVAFDSIVSSPNSIETVHSPARGLLLLANNFGAHYDVPSLHARYLPAGPGMVTNTFTIYFTYFTAFGWIGTAIAMWLLGAISSAVFRRAALGSPIAAMFYALLAQRLVMSFYSEQFLIGINAMIKAFIFFAVVFFFCWRRPPQPASTVDL